MKPLDTIVPGLVSWRASDPVTVLDRPAKPERVSTEVPADLAVVKAALDAIPNSGADELEYDLWRNVCFAVHQATGGDDIGAALIHEFSARSSKYDVEFLDNRVLPYIRDRDDGVTVRTLYSIAGGYGFVDPTLLDDFNVLPPDPMGAEPSNTVSHNADGSDAVPQGSGGTRFKALTLAEFTVCESPVWLVRDVLPQAGLAVLFGESTSGKTFFALDMAGAIARGVEWRDKKVKQGRVVYICAEGIHGFRNRVRAYLRHHTLDDMDMRVIADAPNFMQADHIRDVMLSVLACGGVSLIVVDTFAQVMPGANENSGEDMGKALYHCRKLHEKTGALVMLIHHSGKDASKGARGWSGLRAGADAEIEISRFENDRSAKISKLKDGEDGAEFPFSLETVPVGVTDDEGDPIMSCVVGHDATRAPVTRRGRQEPKGAVEKKVLRAVGDLVTVGEAPAVSEVINIVVDEIPFDAGTNKRDTRRQTVLRALTNLTERALLRVTNGVVAFPDEASDL